MRILIFVIAVMVISNEAMAASQQFQFPGHYRGTARNNCTVDLVISKQDTNAGEEWRFEDRLQCSNGIDNRFLVRIFEISHNGTLLSHEIQSGGSRLVLFPRGAACYLVKMDSEALSFISGLQGGSECGSGPNGNYYGYYNLWKRGAAWPDDIFYRPADGYGHYEGVYVLRKVE